MFEKYMHLEAFGTTEVEGIEVGQCHIFPKLDGTNGSVWFDDGIQCGSRNRHLTPDVDDNQGFREHVFQNESLKKFSEFFPSLRLYGEWLVPHTFKGYRENAWREFYVFDVFDGERFIEYDIYKEYLEKFGINYIPPLRVRNNPSVDELVGYLKEATFLVQDGQVGEGIVIKNYGYVNRFGRTCWAKMVSNQFKDKHIGHRDKAQDSKYSPELEMVDKFVDKHLCEKVYAKIENELGYISKKEIPRYLNTVFYDLVRECTWEFIKKDRPKIDFKALQNFCYAKAKEFTPLFQ